jgi:hypothetical protein
MEGDAARAVRGRGARRFVMAGRWIAIVCGGVLAACGGGQTPPEQCDALVNDLCAKGVSCLGGSEQACVQTFQQQLPCGTAKGVSASYGRCIDEINVDQCSILFPIDSSTGQPKLVLPADCKAVILF